MAPKQYGGGYDRQSVQSTAMQQNSIKALHQNRNSLKEIAGLSLTSPVLNKSMRE